MITIATNPTVKMDKNEFLSRWPGAEELIDLVVERRPGMGSYYYYAGFYPAMTVFPARFRFDDDLGEILSYDVRSSDLDTAITTSVETLRNAKQAFRQHIIDYFADAETLVLCALDRVREGYFPVGRGEKVLDNIQRRSISSMIKSYDTQKYLRVADWLMPDHHLHETAARVEELYRELDRAIAFLREQFQQEAVAWVEQYGTDDFKQVTREYPFHKWMGAYLHQRALAEGYGEAHTLDWYGIDAFDLKPIAIGTLKRLKIVDKDDFAIAYRYGNPGTGRRYYAFSPPFARGIWLYTRPLFTAW